MSTARDTLKALAEEQRTISMTRGQPSNEQFDLSLPMLTCVGPDDVVTPSGIDVRNYPGGIQGLVEVRELFAPVLQLDPTLMIAWNNSSLELMQKILMFGLLVGLTQDNGRGWKEDGKVKAICEVPGYDRHFTMLEQFGIEIIPVRMTEFGPDIEEIERLVSSDPAIRLLFSVPFRSNPTGYSWTTERLTRLASITPAAPSFYSFFDNAYAMHDFVDNGDERPNIQQVFTDCGVADRVLQFTGGSKMTFASGSIGLAGACEEMIALLVKYFGSGCIGPNKVEQLRHVKFLGAKGLEQHMREQGELVRPRMEAVLSVLEQELGGTGLASWTHPVGGYFISLDTAPGLATRACELAGECGVTFTPPGATFPGGQDPKDSNIRIAPTRPSVEEVTFAMRVLCNAIRVASEEVSG